MIRPRPRSTSTGTRSRSKAEARYPELRRQKWVIKQRELQLIASKNFLLPRLDATGIYRWYGFGNDLWDSQPQRHWPILRTPWPC